MAPRLLIRSWQLALLLLALAVGQLRADEVILRDGTQIQGEVLESAKDQPLRVSVIRRGNRVLVEIPRKEVRYVRQLSNAEERLIREAETALLDGKHAESIELLSQLVKQRPTDARAHRELGFALLMSGQAKRARGPLREACRLDPIDLEAHLELAQTLARANEVDEAITCFRRATRLGPRHVGAWRALASLLLTRAEGEDRNEALDALRRACLEEPADEGLLLERVTALLSGDPAEARRVLEAFLERHPKVIHARRFQAQLDAAEGHYRTARERIEAIVTAPRDALLRERLQAELSLYQWLQDGAVQLAPPGLDAGEPALDLRQAGRRLLLLLEALPGDGRLVLALARIELRNGGLGEARGLLEQAALSGPAQVTADALLLQQVAGALIRAQIVPGAQAVETFFGPSVAVPKAQRLVQLAPWLEQSHQTLAQAHVRDGDFDEAAKAYRAALPWAVTPAAKARFEQAAADALLSAERKRRNRDL